MITTAVIILVSAFLFVYWFRYTCLLILSAKTSRDYAEEVAAANGLTFARLEQQLAVSLGRPELEQLHSALQREYEIVSGLLRHTRAWRGSAVDVESWMLRVDYKIMQVWYQCVRNVSVSHAAAATTEMAQIIRHFADAMGERALCPANL